MRRGSDSLGMGRGFNSAMNRLEFCFNFASMFATIFAPIVATIAPRSGHDRASIVVLVVRRSPSFRPATCPRRNLLDRGSIAPRSRFDRAAIVEFFLELPTPSDVNPTLQRSSRRGADRDHMAVRSESDDPAIFTKRGRSRSHGRQIGIRRSRDLHAERRIAVHVAVGSVKSGRLDGLDRVINPRCDRRPFEEDPRSEKCHVATRELSIIST